MRSNLLKIFGRLYYPVVLIIFIWIGSILWHQVESEDFKSLSVLCLGLICLVVTLLFEKLVPFKKEWNKNQGDFWCDFIHTNIVFPFVTFVGLVLINLMVDKVRFYLPIINEFNLLKSEWVPINLLLSLLISEFFYYWYHRVAHKNNFLWGLHEIHHAPLRVYSMNSARFHPVEVLVTNILYCGPLILINTDPYIIYLISIINMVTGFLEHTNTNLNFSIINYFFNTPDLHRRHHSNIIKDDCNFGKVTIFWDMIFRTYHRGKESNQSVGLRNNKLLGNRILKLWIDPFSKRNKNNCVENLK